MIVLVTGATAGFGECITRRFIENGHKVIATGRRQSACRNSKMSWVTASIPRNWTYVIVHQLKRC